MTGYRETDNGYDPYAYDQPGRPMRPYNWVQWVGVTLIVAGIAALLAVFAGRAGWIAPLVKDVQVSTALTIIGSLLVNSRREPGTQVGELQRRRNRKVLLITLAICAVVLGAAIAIEFKGA
jgi:hypothetical protein